MQRNIPVIAGLTAAGVYLANRMRSRTLPHVEFTTQGSGPTVSTRETIVVRPMSPAMLGTLGALAAGGYMAWAALKKKGSASSSSVQASIELNVPVSTAYNQWTQFEEFPRFMDTVKEVKQIDDTHLHWRADVAGKSKEWDAEITEQIPDKRIAWRSTTGVQNAGVVSFHRVGANRTKVMLQMDYDPQTLDEKVGDAVGAVKRTAKGNLKRFKQLVEARGVESGAWRGSVAQH